MGRPPGSLNSTETNIRLYENRVNRVTSNSAVKQYLNWYGDDQRIARDVAGAQIRANNILDQGSYDALGMYTGSPTPDAVRLAAVEQAKIPESTATRTAGTPDQKKKVQAKTTPKANNTPAPVRAPVSLAAPVAMKERNEAPQVFPKVIESAPYNMKIFFAPYNADLALKNGEMMKTETSVVFPLPANLLSSTGLDYTNVNLGAIGGELIGAAKDLVNDPDFFGKLNSQIRTGVQLATGDNAASQDLRSVLLRRLVQGVSSTAGAAADLITGSTPNPHVAVTFNNVKLRTFSFTWKFSPTSAAESESLRKIIRMMQRRILPERNSNFLLRYPNQVQIQLKPDPLNQLFRFKPAVITDLVVNYAPNGVPSFFKDDMPTDVELSLSFQEIQIRTASDYDDNKQGQE